METLEKRRSKRKGKAETSNVEEHDEATFSLALLQLGAQLRVRTRRLIMLQPKTLEIVSISRGSSYPDFP